MRKDPVIIDVGTPVIEAAQLMRVCNVTSLLVACRGRVIGMVTETDIVRNFVGANKVSYFFAVQDIIRSPVLGIDAQRPLSEAAHLMLKHGTFHLGVTRAGTFIGIISARDFLKPALIYSG
ncbi:MAG: CBS domain-containing protein [Nitrospira sp.]|nr:CBS domain-containing protein [Nitrospira sp.]